MRIRNMIWGILSGTVCSLLIVMQVLAYTYYAPITVTSTSAYTMLGMIAATNNQALIDGGYITASGLDTDVTFGTSVPHMLSTDKVLFADDLPIGTKGFKYEMGNTPETDFEIVCGYNGYITTTDVAALEPGETFDITVDGYFDTSSGAGKNILYKQDALKVYVQAAGNIRAAILSAGDVEELAVDGAMATGTHELEVIYDGFYLAIYVDSVLKDIDGSMSSLPADWGLTDYGMRKTISVLGSTTGILTNYPIKLTIYQGTGVDSGNSVYLSDHCQDDFDDIRFTTDDGTTELDYWVESYTSGVSAVVWVEFDTLAASPSTTDFFIYTDYAAAVSDSNGANTFTVFDDFERGSNGDAIGGSWTVLAGDIDISTEHAYGGTRSAKFKGDAASSGATLPVTASDTIAIYFMYWKEDACGTVSFYHGNGTRVAVFSIEDDEDIMYFDGAAKDTGDNAVPDAWAFMEANDFDWTGFDYDIWNALAEIQADAGCANETWSEDIFTVQNQDVTVGDDVYIDNVIVRNWATDEPSVDSWGTMQLQTITWARYASNPVMEVGAGWDSDGVWNRSIIKENGTYYMWFTGIPHNVPYSASGAQIGLATSTDLITWTKSGSNPVLLKGAPGAWDDDLVASPSVMKIGSTYYMWYAGGHGTTIKIGMATSTDKVTWTKYASNPVMSIGSVGQWDDATVGDPYVIKIGSTYYMYYSGHDGANQRVGVATSANGTTWSKYGANPIIDIVPGTFESTNACRPVVKLIGTTYYMFYHGWDGALANGYDRVAMATSADALTWTKSGDNPSLDVGNTGEWDDVKATPTELLQEGNTLYLFYAGGHSGAYPEVQVGYATYTFTSSLTVPNTINDWIWMQGNTMPYAEYITMFANGVDVLWYQPNAIVSGTTLPDRQGTAQNGIITWGSNPAGVTISVGALVGGVVDPATTTTTGGITVPPIVPPGETSPIITNPPVTSSIFNPFFDVIDDLTDHKFTPEWQGMAYATLLCAGFIIFVGSRTQSFFLAIAAGGLGLGLGYLLRFFADLWIFWVFGFLAIAALLLDARKSW